MAAAILLLAIPLMANEQEAYSLVRVPWGYRADVPCEMVSARPGVWAEFALPESDFAILRARAVPFEIRISDMREFYASRLDETLDMGGWRTYEMILAALDSLHDEYPAYVSAPESIGVGWDGKIIKAIKISDNIEIDEDEPEVFIGGALHAREVITPEIVLSFARWLLDSMATSEVARHIVEKRETWIIPLLNPDGYYYNQISSPTGGGMWRKNRHDNGDGTMGVDLNRNYPHMWGFDDIGSSPVSSEETYRGPSAGSEPETQATMAFIDSREFRSSLSFHSYGNLYLLPWGWTYDLPVHNDWFLRVGYRYARGNSYIYGPGATAIYPTNGDTDDWLYGDTTGHSWIFCCTPEVGGYSDGFWPPLSRKDQLVFENMPVCKVVCQMAGSAPFMTRAWVDPEFGDSSGYADPGERSRLLVEIENLGFDPTEAYVLGFSGTSGLDMVTDSALCGTIESQGYDTVAFLIDIDESRIVPGDEVTILFEVRDTSGHLTFDSTKFVCGTPIVISEWDFESGGTAFIGSGDWEWGTPTTGPGEAVSGTKLWATKLADDYTNNRLSELLVPMVDIPDSSFCPRFTFKHWFSFEPPSGGDIYDGANVQVSTDGGSSWDIISPISGYDGVAYDHNPYLEDDSVFTANSGGWQTATFDMEPFAGSSVQIKFVVGTDPYISSLGWFIDDVSFIYYIEPELATDREFRPTSFGIDIYPNPFNSSCHIELQSPVTPEGSHIEILDATGRIVRRLDFAGTESTWDGKDSSGNELPSGVYLMKTGDGRTDARKALLIK